MNARDTLALVLLAAVWGGSFLFIRIAVPGFGPVPLMAARVALAALALGAIVAVLRKPIRLRAHARGLLLLGAINAAGPFTLIAWAELHLTASLAALLNATVPLFTAVVSAVWLKERVTGRQALGLGLGVMGVGVLVGWSPLTLSRATALSVLAMLAAALCYAVAAVYTKRHLATASAPSLAVGQQIAAGAWLTLPALWLLPNEAPPPAAVGALLGLAILSTALAYLLFFHLIASVGPTKTNSVTFLIPLFGVAWGRIFLDEPLTAGMFVGLALILASLLLVSEVRPRRPHSTKRAARPRLHRTSANRGPQR